MSNIEELRRLAEAATPGPWFAEASWQSTFLEGKHDGKWAIRKSNTSFGFAPLAYVKGDKRITGGDGSLNAQFIAAANPAAVLELIAEVECLRGKNREHFDACIGCDDELKRVTKQRDELLAAIKQIKSNLMRYRLYGQDSGLMHAIVQAEGDAEEAITKAEG